MKYRWLLLPMTIAVIGVILQNTGILPLGTLLTPVQTAAAKVADWADRTLFSGTWEQRFEESRQELAQLREQLADYHRLQQENQWLRDFLDLKDNGSQLMFAQGEIIAVDTTDSYGGFTVNVGTMDDVEVGDPVLSAEGLIGVVAQTGLNRSQVRTLYHPDVQVSAAVSRTGDVGITQSKEGVLWLTTLPRDCTVQAEDLIVTSGWGGIYPAGLLIGTAEEIIIDPDGISLTVTVKPFFLPEDTRQVMIITEFEG